MKNGFTMIELVISLAIFVALSGGAFIYIGNFNDRKNLDLAVDELESTVRLARTMAMSSQLPELPEGAGTFELKWVEVKSGVGGGSLVVSANDGSSVKNYFEKKINDGITIDNISGGGVLRFSIFDGKLRDDSNNIVSNNVTITLKQQNGENVRQIVVDKYGKIQ